MTNFVNWLQDIAVGILMYTSAGATVFFDALDELQAVTIRRVRRYFTFLFCGTIVSLLILIIGLAIGSGKMVVISGILSAVMLLMVYITFLTPVAVLEFLTADVIGISRLSGIKEGVKSALFPLLSATFFISALASILASAGVKHLPFWTVVIYAAFVLVLVIFSLFFKGNSLAAHYLVLALVIWNFLTFVFPIPTKTLVLRVTNTINKWSITDKSSAEGEIILIPKGVQLYKMNDDDQFIKSEVNEKEVRAKIVTLEKDDKSGENIYEVLIDTSGKDNFIGLESAFVPLRSIKIIEQDRQDQNQNKNKQNGTQQVQTKETIDTVRFIAGKVVATGITINGYYDNIEFIPVSGKFEIPGSSGWELVDRHITLPGGNSGALSIKGVTSGTVIIKQY